MISNEHYTVQNLAICDRVLDFLVQLNRHLLVLLLIPAAVIGFWPDFKGRDAAQRELTRLTSERDLIQEKVHSMNRKLDYLKNYPEYLEVVARDRLQMHKDGEVIMRFEKRPEN